MKTRIVLSDPLKRDPHILRQIDSKLKITLTRYSPLIEKILVKLEQEHDTISDTVTRCRIKIVMKNNVSPVETVTTMPDETDAFDHCLSRTRRTLFRRVAINGLKNRPLQYGQV